MRIFQQGDLEHHFIASNGITLHVVQAGPMNGPIALLLHGFPDFWRSWIGQIDLLVQAGYRVWIPDQRGYNESEKPFAITAYHIDTLADDICGLIEQTGRAKVTLFGHDWGGAIAWWLAHRDPQLIDRLVVINAAHFSVIFQHMRSNPRQLLRSWYMYFFRMPWLPEYFLSRRNFKALSDALTRHTLPNTFDTTEMDHYRAAWSRPGAITSMLNWYRAIMQNKAITRIAGHITVPSLLLWGAQDHALGLAMARPSIDLCDAGSLVVIQDTGHWVHREVPGIVNRHIVEFLAKSV